MKTFLTKRRNAVIISIVLMIIFAVFGITRSLNSAADEISDLFYNGVYDDDEGYLRPSINDQLDTRCNIALGLIGTASEYDSLSELTENLRQARYALMDAESIHDKYTANEALTTAFYVLYEALISENLSDSDLSAAEDYLSKMNSSGLLIQNSGYNNAVEEFKSGTLNKFPTVILWAIFGGDEPELFS